MEVKRLINKLKIENYKSIKQCDIDLNNVNVLIGENGAGKSNFINFFKLIRNIADEKLLNFVATNDGADDLLYYGQKESDHIMGEVKSTLPKIYTEYRFILEPTKNNKLFFSTEEISLIPTQNNAKIEKSAKGDFETNIFNNNDNSKPEVPLLLLKRYILDFNIYHFHDTSPSAKVKKPCL
jgi:predicted ATPase